MVDTREGPVKAEDLPYAFDKQHPLKRIAIVIAGPLMNLLLAFILYSISFSFGIIEVKPIVGTVESGSVASLAGFEAGDKIKSINNKPVSNWGDVHTEILLNLESKQSDIAVTASDGSAQQRKIDIAGTLAANEAIDQNGYIGLLPYKVTNQIGQIIKNSPAEKSGLKVGDIIVSVDGEAKNTWLEWSKIFKQSPGERLKITYLRGDKQFTTDLRPNPEESTDGKLIGKVGIAPMLDQSWNNNILIKYTPSVGEAFILSWHKMINYAGITVKFFGKLLLGEASLKHISGPVSIANAAGQTASQGIQSYLEFLALVSISLGVLNLLPIPVLDGGHLVYYMAEWIKGKPLSMRTQMIGLRLGMMLMFFLMIVAFFNDITRLFGQ